MQAIWRYKLFIAALLALILAASLWLASSASIPLLPFSQLQQAHVSADHMHGGASQIALREKSQGLDVDLQLSPKLQYPYATLGVIYDAEKAPTQLDDWATYEQITLLVKCEPANELSFVLHTDEPGVARFDDITSFRPSVTFFSCHDQWQPVAINLRQLNTPEWWLKEHGLGLSHQAYALDKVRGYSLATTQQSPMNTPSRVALQQATLTGQRPVYRWASVAFALLALALLIGVLFRHALVGQRANSQSSGKPKAQQPEVSEPPAYEPIALDPRQQREQQAVLDYLSRHYTDSELTMDKLVAALGINRMKVNDILRDAHGKTFSAYLNDLRLTEAARLLSTGVAVSEVAYAVGYGSLSYFNRVFKKAYGCPPSQYINRT